MLETLWLAWHYKEKSLNLPSSFKLSDHSLQLWYARVGDESKIVEQATEKLLSPSEKKRFQSTKSNKKRREFLLSRALMRHALDLTFPDQKNEWEFVEHHNSIPEINKLPGNAFLSLSHSNGLICFTIANYPVGVDLEMNKQRDFIELAKVFMNDEEHADLVNRVRSTKELAKTFYQNWCAKEAYYKAISKTDQPSINLKNISISDLADQYKNWFLLEWEIEQFIIAVVIEEEPVEIRHHHFLSTNQIIKTIT